MEPTAKKSKRHIYVRHPSVWIGHKYALCWICGEPPVKEIHFFVVAPFESLDQERNHERTGKEMVEIAATNPAQAN